MRLVLLILLPPSRSVTTKLSVPHRALECLSVDWKGLGIKVTFQYGMEHSGGGNSPYLASVWNNASTREGHEIGPAVETIDWFL